MSLTTFAHVVPMLIAWRVRAAACDGCSVPATWVNGLSQSQYDPRAEKWFAGVTCQSPRPRKLFCTSLVSNEKFWPGRDGGDARIVFGSFSRS